MNRKLLLSVVACLVLLASCGKDDDAAPAELTCDEFVAKECTAPGKVTFVVTVPQNTPAGPLYMVGNFMERNGGENWNPGAAAFQLKKNPSDANCQCIAVTINNNDEYKFTRGTWETVEKAANCAEVNGGNRVFTGGTKINIAITNWRDVDNCG